MFKSKELDSSKKVIKNPCRICCKQVTEKNGIRCKGACRRWAHFKCLKYDKKKINEIKKGLLKVICPCPSCNARYMRPDYCGKADCRGKQPDCPLHPPQKNFKQTRKECSPIPCMNPKPCAPPCPAPPYQRPMSRYSPPQRPQYPPRYPPPQYPRPQYPTPQYPSPPPTRRVIGPPCPPLHSGDPPAPCRCTAKLRNLPPPKPMIKLEMMPQPVPINPTKSSSSSESMSELLKKAPYCKLDIPQCGPKCKHRPQQPPKSLRRENFEPFCPPCPKRIPPCPDPCYNKKKNTPHSDPPSCLIETSIPSSYRKEMFLADANVGPEAERKCIEEPIPSSKYYGSYKIDDGTQKSISSSSSKSSSSSSEEEEDDEMERACIDNPDYVNEHSAMQISPPIWAPQPLIMGYEDPCCKQYESYYEFSQNMPSHPVVVSQQTETLPELEESFKNMSFSNRNQETSQFRQTHTTHRDKRANISGARAASVLMFPVAGKAPSGCSCDDENKNYATKVSKSKSDSRLMRFRPQQLLKAALHQMCETMDQIKDVMMRMAAVFDQ